MTAQLVVHFNNPDDLVRVLKLLRDNGLDSLTFKPKNTQKKSSKTQKRDWPGIGSVSLGGQLDHINIRDFAYEE
jgi:hypothetical protein